MSIEAMKLALELYELDSSDENHGRLMLAVHQAIEQAQKQEPVAWITEKISGPTRGYMTVTFNKDTGWKDARSIPLYEHPPQRQPEQEPDDLHIAYMSGLHRGKELAQRQWVGLTLDEKHHLNDILNLDGRFPVIDAIEAKLKEKNTP